MRIEEERLEAVRKLEKKLGAEGVEVIFSRTKELLKEMRTGVNLPFKDFFKPKGASKREGIVAIQPDFLKNPWAQKLHQFGGAEEHSLQTENETTPILAGYKRNLKEWIAYLKERGGGGYYE